jgi:hypothetical protein
MLIFSYILGLTFHFVYKAAMHFEVIFLTNNLKNKIKVICQRNYINI